MVSWKRGSWVRGEQAATTTRLRLFSSMASRIFSWVSWEQVNRLSEIYTTLGSDLAYSATAGTSATPPIFMPQLQTKTPTRGSSPATERSAGSSFTVVMVLRASTRGVAAAAAAALASITEMGMSLQSRKAPHT